MGLPSLPALLAPWLLGPELSPQELYHQQGAGGGSGWYGGKQGAVSFLGQEGKHTEEPGAWASRKKHHVS